MVQVRKMCPLKTRSPQLVAGWPVGTRVNISPMVSGGGAVHVSNFEPDKQAWLAPGSVVPI